MTVVRMPISGKQIEVPDDLIRKGHSTNFILDKSVRNYHHNTEAAPAGFEYEIMQIKEVEADFTGRFVDYNPVRLKSVLNALCGGTNLPPVSVKRTGCYPRYTLEDGYHRYIASVLAGFSAIPCLIRKEPEPKASIQPKSIATPERPPPDETPEEAMEQRKRRFGL